MHGDRQVPACSSTDRYVFFLDDLNWRPAGDVLQFVVCRTTGLIWPPTLGTIQDVIDLAFALVKAKSGKQIVHDYKCAVSKRQVEW